MTEKLTDMDRWLADAKANGWSMPSAPWWKRLPVVRHVRAAIARSRVESWYAAGPGIFGIPTGYDQWVVFGIWHGLERAPGSRHPATANQSRP